jgi:hypothetical protein
MECGLSSAGQSIPMIRTVQLHDPAALRTRVDRWEGGGRDLVMAICCALHHFRVRRTPWQPMV